MTDNEKQEINELRSQGLGYKAIAKRLSISENTVKSYCRRHKVGIKVPKEDFSNEKLHFCKCCGALVEQKKGVREIRFCSDTCRRAWWNSHLDLVDRKANYEYICAGCGRAFTVYGNSHRKFCSPGCYIDHRFGGAVNG